MEYCHGLWSIPHFGSRYSLAQIVPNLWSRFFLPQQTTWYHLWQRLGHGTRLVSFWVVDVDGSWAYRVHSFLVHGKCDHPR